MATSPTPNPQASAPQPKVLVPAGLPEWNPIDLARLAAYIDGEGHIRISGPGKRWTDHIGLRIANTDYKLHVWLKGTFGGYISVVRGRCQHYKKCWSWNASGNLSYALLKACIPYFIMKLDQAEIAIGLHELVQAQIMARTSGVKKNQYAVVCEEDLAKRKKFKEQLTMIRSNPADRMAS